MDLIDEGTRSRGMLYKSATFSIFDVVGPLKKEFDFAHSGIDCQTLNEHISATAES